MWPIIKPHHDGTTHPSADGSRSLSLCLWQPGRSASGDARSRCSGAAAAAAAASGAAPELAGGRPRSSVPHSCTALLALPWLTRGGSRVAAPQAAVALRASARDEGAPRRPPGAGSTADGGTPPSSGLRPAAALSWMRLRLLLLLPASAAAAEFAFLLRNTHSAASATTHPAAAAGRQRGDRGVGAMLPCCCCSKWR